jgi:hypothetical protein
MKQAREETKEAWAKGAYVGDIPNAYALGGLAVLDQVIEQLIYEEIKGEIDD